MNAAGMTTIKSTVIVVVDGIEIEMIDILRVVVVDMEVVPAEETLTIEETGMTRESQLSQQW